MSTQSQLLVRVLADLGANGICVLNGYEGYPEVIPSDVDIAATSAAHIKLKALIENGVYDVVQALQYEHNSTRYEFIAYDNPPVFLGIDVSTDIRSNGRVFFRCDEFVKSAHQFKRLIPVPRADLEFAAYFLKKILKKELTAEHGLRLSRLWSQAPDRSYQQVLNLLPEPRATIVAKAATSGDWIPVQKELSELRKTVLRVVGLKDPFSIIRYWHGEVRRWVNRILHPTGLMIVFLGPDGVGKSTVIDRVRTELAPAFKGRTKAYHLRPAWVGRKASSTSTTSPHAQVARSVGMSLLKLGFWWLDYTLGYWLDVFPRMIRATLITFDRYYDDLLVDPKRYRFTGPKWLVRLVGRLIPHPDLVVLLDAPPEVISSRKQELSGDEVFRLREEYRAVVGSMPNGHIVDAAGSIEQVVSAIEHVVLHHMKQRTVQRMRDR